MELHLVFMLVTKVVSKPNSAAVERVERDTGLHTLRFWFPNSMFTTFDVPQVLHKVPREHGL